jgi:hypothetical protein
MTKYPIIEPTIEHPYDEVGNPADGHCKRCGCLRSVHHIGVDAHVIKGCPCGNCECGDAGNRRPFEYADVLPYSVHEAWGATGLADLPEAYR